MSEPAARDRDASGEQYAVLLSVQAKPKALFQIHWDHRHLGLFLFDECGRRNRELEYRQLEPGRLHLMRYQEWRHASDADPEYPEHPERGWYFTMTIDPDGRARRELHELDGSSHTWANVPVEHRTVAKAEFGAWTAYVDAQMLGLSGSITLVPAQDPVYGPASGTAPAWSAPLPLRPRHLEALFTPGSRLASDDGRDDARSFTATVPPGDYAVLIASMRWEGTDREGETPAVMVRILDKPTVSWELALLPGQDLSSSELRAPETGTNLIAYSSGLGDGSYPVWTGRDADGEVTSFVADMLILTDADALPPTVPSTAVCLPPFTPVTGDRREAPFTNPGATAEFMATQISQVTDGCG
ncbi:DUF4241 domain-containing protein [Nonomuraea spiralis]|uniref:DUF4241 domain-containing protein n=1 Tax=Nonomuraea spiralis TaxID=46182 RepID=UPI0037A706FD